MVLIWFPWSIFMLCCSFSLIFPKFKFCFHSSEHLPASSASSFEFSAVILQVGPSYLASGAQACLCLFIELPLKASSSLLVCGSACASSFIPFLSPQHPPPLKHTHTHSLSSPPNKGNKEGREWQKSCHLKPWQELQGSEEEREDTMRGKSGSEPYRKVQPLGKTCQLINSLSPGDRTLTNRLMLISTDSLIEWCISGWNSSDMLHVQLSQKKESWHVKYLSSGRHGNYQGGDVGTVHFCKG